MNDEEFREKRIKADFALLFPLMAKMNFKTLTESHEYAYRAGRDAERLSQRRLNNTESGGDNQAKANTEKEIDHGRSKRAGNGSGIRSNPA